jgi:hypothetical protein
MEVRMPTETILDRVNASMLRDALEGLVAPIVKRTIHELMPQIVDLVAERTTTPEFSEDTKKHLNNLFDACFDNRLADDRFVVRLQEVFNDLIDNTLNNRVRSEVADAFFKASREIRGF